VSAEVEAAQRDGEELLGRLQAHAHGAGRGSDPETVAVLAQCRAEQARLHNRADPAALDLPPGGLCWRIHEPVDLVIC